jgi:5,5'-dehydrodivanillate O-demethylase
MPDVHQNPALEFADLEAVGPGTPAGRYLRSFWQPVCRARELAPGQTKPLEILGERFTVYRGEGGVPHVTAFRCPHRGTQLSLGWVEGDSLRCRYHGWRYDGAGRCVEQPNEDRPFCEKVTLKSHPTREYVGLIFTYLGDGEPPPFRNIPDLDRPGVIVTDPPEVLPCSYWNKLDNDHGHIPWVHRATAFRKNRKDLLVLREENVTESAWGWTSHRFIPGREADTVKIFGLGRTSHFLMPNTRLFWIRTRAKGFEDRELWDTKAVWTVPINDVTFVSFDVTHTPLTGAEGEAYAASRYEQQEREAETRWDLAEAILAGEMMLEDLPEDMGAYTSFAIEDYVTQVGMGPLKGRPKEMLVRTDVKVALQRRMWLREVGALMAGKATKDWALPKEPLADLMGDVEVGDGR